MTNSYYRLFYYLTRKEFQAAETLWDFFESVPLGERASIERRTLDMALIFRSVYERIKNSQDTASPEISEPARERANIKNWKMLYQSDVEPVQPAENPFFLALERTLDKVAINRTVVQRARLARLVVFGNQAFAVR